MYHKLTVYVKGRYQTDFYPSCCFGDKYHKYRSNFVNTLQISFIFLHTMHSTMLHRCTGGFELMFNSLSVRGSNLFCGPKLQEIMFFISLGKNQPVRLCICIYGTNCCVVQHEGTCSFYFTMI